MKTNFVLSLAVGLLLIAGCQTAKVAHPLTADLSGSDPDAQLSFWHTLAERTVTSNDEAFHGLLLFLDSKDDAAAYGDRVAALKSRKMLPAGFNQPGDQAVERGTLAVAICRVLEIKGGAMMRLTNNNPRYAVRELEFEELYPPSSPNQTFSGSEFLGIIGRMEDYQRGNTANIPASMMPSEMGTHPVPTGVR
jgi:hypothetical protein